MANKSPHLVMGRDVGTPLSERGELQAKLLGQRLKKEGWSFDRVISSHAARAKLTALLCCKELGFPLERIEEDKRVVEVTQGSLEKQPRKEVYKEGGPIMTGVQRELIFFRPPGYSPDGDQGESQFDCECRFAAFAEDLLEASRGADQEQTVLVASHGLAIRTFLRGILGGWSGVALHMHTENTSITELRYDPKDGEMGGWSIVRMSDSAHLACEEMK